MFFFEVFEQVDVTRQLYPQRGAFSASVVLQCQVQVVVSFFANLLM